MIDWLTNAFGFRERFKEVRQDGSLGHVEMELGDAVIMMGTRRATRTRSTSGR